MFLNMFSYLWNNSTHPRSCPSRAHIRELWLTNIFCPASASPGDNWPHVANVVMWLNHADFLVLGKRLHHTTTRCESLRFRTIIVCVCVWVQVFFSLWQEVFPWRPLLLSLRSRGTGRVTMRTQVRVPPEVIFQAHSASLSLSFPLYSSLSCQWQASQAQLKINK